MPEGRDSKGRYELGYSGNPNGRPKGSLSLTTLLRRTLEGAVLGGTPTPDGRPVAEWFVECMVREAMKGNPAYMKEIMDRIEGKQKASDGSPEPLGDQVPRDDNGGAIEP